MLDRQPKTCKDGKRRKKTGLYKISIQGGKRRKKLAIITTVFLTLLPMDISEVLQFVDEVVYAKEGKRLNDLQRGIIEGTLKRQKYSQIAKDYNCTVGHAKEVGYELWQMLSEIFSETVDKKHLQSILERQRNLNINLGNNNTFQNNEINYINNCPTSSPPTSDESEPASPNRRKKKKQGQMKLISKLRQFGLTDEQIAEALNLPLEAVKPANLER